MSDLIWILTEATSECDEYILEVCGVFRSWEDFRNNAILARPDKFGKPRQWKSRPSSDFDGKDYSREVNAFQNQYLTCWEIGCLIALNEYTGKGDD